MKNVKAKQVQSEKGCYCTFVRAGPEDLAYTVFALDFILREHKFRPGDHKKEKKMLLSNLVYHVLCLFG